MRGHSSSGAAEKRGVEDMAVCGSQHRRVFVGNIPYDATEEQLIQICEEVGPVVSFRLVLDRETGKPKGYGFCEYRDEETALSALRNLQGYEMNGRRLRVNFAENDKPQAGAPILGDSSLHRPLGLPVAANAASLMANSLSAVPNSVQNMAGLGNDPLTHHLARMSAHQLYERLSEIKTIAAQNKDVARQLLQGHPQLLKALFQAELMLGMVPTQMEADKRPSSSSVLQPSLQDNVMGQNSVLQSHLSQTPLQKEALTQMSNPLHSPAHLQQHAPAQLQFQHALPPQPQNLQHGAILNKSGIPIQPQSLGDLSNQPFAPLPTSNPLVSQPQPSILPSVGHHPQLALPNTSLQQSYLPHSQAGASNNPVLLNGQGILSKEHGTSASFSNDSSWESRMGKHVGLMEKTGMTGDISELTYHHSKRPRLEGGAHFLMSNSSSGISSHSTQSICTGLVPGSQTTNADSSQHSEKPVPQIPPDVESSLLQQVMNLKPEQLGSLPLEQQQQVLQLQQMLTLKQKVISVV